MGVDEETASLLRMEAAPEPQRGRCASVAACVTAVGVVRETPSDLLFLLLLLRG